MTCYFIIDKTDEGRELHISTTYAARNAESDAIVEGWRKHQESLGYTGRRDRKLVACLYPGSALDSYGE